MDWPEVRVDGVVLFDRTVAVLTGVFFTPLAAYVFFRSVHGCGLSHGGMVTPWSALFCSRYGMGDPAGFLLAQALFLLLLLAGPYLVAVLAANAQRIGA